MDALSIKTKKEKLDKNWWKKAAEEADIILSDHDDEDDKREKVRFSLSEYFTKTIRS